MYDAALDLSPNIDLVAEINRLKKAKNAVILAHYYQEEDIQDIADFVGDSLELARAAQRSDAKLILFAGVHFMAEGAKILNPASKVLLPDLRAGCSLSDSCPPEAFARFRAKHPDHFVVSYINCSAAIKAQSDVIVTSSNAVKIVEKIPKDKPILFAPDRNLGAFVAKQTGRELLLWQGTCIVHETASQGSVRRIHVSASEVHSRKPVQELHHRDRRRNPSSDEEEIAGEDFHPGASERLVRLQRVPVHEAQHAGEDLSRHARREA
jgi:quinolinate synthase